MALTALIFDVDGTLVDSNPAHVQAWRRALKKHQLKVSDDRIGVEIGKGGDKLIPSIFGEEIDRSHGESLRQAHTAEFINIAKATRLALFPGVDSLLRALRHRGIKLALATSSSQKELQATEASAGIDFSNYFDVIANGDDAADSKPAPAIVEAAVGKLKLAPTQCAMVGDTPYDADSARDGGLVSLGVTCGGMNDEKTLHGNGMRAVFRDPADIAARLDFALQTASPAPIVLTQKIIDVLMRQAILVAREGMEKGEAPIGCVIARGDGTIIAAGHNELNATQNKTAHAEMVAFSRAAGKISPQARDLVLVSTLEPCVMCLGASMEAAVDTILFGLDAPADGGRLRVRPPVSPESQMPRIVGRQLADESRALFKEFLNASADNPEQVKFVRQLLERTG